MRHRASFLLTYAPDLPDTFETASLIFSAIAEMLSELIVLSISGKSFYDGINSPWPWIRQPHILLISVLYIRF